MTQRVEYAELNERLWKALAFHSRVKVGAHNKRNTHKQIPGLI
jgi:hypothetical protein